MKKAELKKMKELLATLPEIPILQGGEAKFSQIFKSGSVIMDEGVKTDGKGKAIDINKAYSSAGPEKGHYINKVKFFTEYMKSGNDPKLSMQRAVDAWNEKFKRVQEILSNIKPKPEEPQKDIEQLKQDVADEWQKRENRLRHK